MIIDAHNHPNWHGYGIDRHVENMDQYGIQVTWMHTWEAEFTGEEGGTREHYADPRALSGRDPLPLEGVIEAVRLEGSTPGSPRWAVGVQWHPEFDHAADRDGGLPPDHLDATPLLDEFLGVARRRRTRTEEEQP